MARSAPAILSANHHCCGAWRPRSHADTLAAEAGRRREASCLHGNRRPCSRSTSPRLRARRAAPGRQRHRRLYTSDSLPLALACRSCICSCKCHGGPAVTTATGAGTWTRVELVRVRRSATVCTLLGRVCIFPSHFCRHSALSGQYVYSRPRPLAELITLTPSPRLAGQLSRAFLPTLDLARRKCRSPRSQPNIDAAYPQPMSVAFSRTHMHCVLPEFLVSR